MNIYFAASIRGGDQDRDVYAQLIRHLAKHGRVLTEHIAVPGRMDFRTHGITEGEIYDTDMAWLGESDVVIAEVSTPSLGVGYELCRAEHLGKPCLVLWRPREGKYLSAMIIGSRHFLVKEYKDIDAAKTHIDDFLRLRIQSMLNR